MKQIWLIILAAFLLAMSLSPHVLAAEICYPVAVEQSEDGAEIRKTYDLAPEEDPGGIPRSDYVTGYNVSAEYSGTVSRIALDRVRYVAIFERTTFVPEEPPPEEIENPNDPGLLETPELPGEVSPTEDSTPGFRFSWAFLLIPLAVVAVGGGGLGIALFLRRRSESREETH